MSVRFTASEYATACRLAGRWLDGSRPALLRPDRQTGVTCGIYIALARSAGTGELRPLYVGKADRRPDGDMAERIAGHRRGDGRRLLFTWIAVIPLRADVPEEEILRIEGDIARHLGVPLLCRAVPRKRRAAARSTA